jgi:hypothetical protein
LLFEVNILDSLRVLLNRLFCISCILALATLGAYGDSSSVSSNSSSSQTSSTKTVQHVTHHNLKKVSHSRKKSHGKANWRRGQQIIQPARAHEIQAALVREHYLKSEPSGVWDSQTQAAMQRYQADHGWQTKMTPDSRALISLGLGPDQEHLLNPESAMTSKPVKPVSDVKPVSAKDDAGKNDTGEAEPSSATPVSAPADTNASPASQTPASQPSSSGSSDAPATEPQ